MWLPCCNRSCAGSLWLRRYLEVVERGPAQIRSLVVESPGGDHFRFGNGGTLKSSRRVRIPVEVGGRLVLLWLCEIPCDSLGCLLGKDVLESLGGMVDFVGQRLLFQFLSQTWIPLSRMRVGHFSLQLLPRTTSGWAKPSSLGWKTVGVGGCCEIQCGRGKVAWRTHSALRRGSLCALEESVCEIAQSHAGTLPWRGGSLDGIGCWSA